MNYDQKEEVSRIAFYLGYDLLSKIFNKREFACDEAYEAACFYAENFLYSEFNKDTEPLYTCLEKFVAEDVLGPYPLPSFNGDEGLMADLLELTEDAFLRAHLNITKEQYDMTWIEKITWKEKNDLNTKNKTFYYRGLSVVAIGNIRGGAANCRLGGGKTITPEGYSHPDFYDVAKKNHLSCDVYRIENHYYIPCNAGFLFASDFWDKIKRVEDYSGWYKQTRGGDK